MAERGNLRSACVTRVIHTADWHLGARLVEQERTEEHARFLDWLLMLIQDRQVQVLLVAGDVFDQANPPQSALSQYYDFFTGLKRWTDCQAVVIGGNHDSASLLDAPRGPLAALGVHVIGAAPEDPARCVVEFADLIVAGVPFLRERDVRTASAGQSAEEIAAALRDGIADYYRRALAAARNVAGGRPVVGMGHLTTVSAQLSGTERDIHIGNLGAVGAACFDGFDYVALGHIHRPQTVAGVETRRYAGSPVALGFDEAEKPRQILILDIPERSGEAIAIESVAVPVARELRRISCTAAEVASQLLAADASALPPWIEWTITDGCGHPRAEALARESAEKAGVRLLKLICPHPAGEAVDAFAGRELRDLQPTEVFLELLRRRGTDPASESGRELLGSFETLLSRMAEAAGR